ncbi:type II toxin-antitoxin system PemK/MazF family toxin [Candidatus Curtissbacteria bacterium]|nr:type II toxin-antitoxin system PemK/MazF family toxin [Candidatus Curtissbacteria bacterium]
MQKSGKDYPKRGQIYIADLDPGFGREIHKKRPVLIISDNAFNQTATHAIIIPSSSVIPSTLSSEIIPIGRPRGFEKESVLLPLFIRSIDQDRLIKKIGKISKQKLLEVEEALKLILGFMPVE